jgi:uncharacterized phiE125 gp8 family phage protein
VRTEAENALQRSLITTTWLITLDAFPRCKSGYPPLYPPTVAGISPWQRSGVIELPKPPIQSVDWVKYVDTNGVLQTLDPSAYVLVAAREPGELWPAFGTSWPVTRDQAGAVTVQFKAGYGADATNVPTPIIHWCKLALTELYEGRRLASDEGALGTFAQGLLDVYRVRSV